MARIYQAPEIAAASSPVKRAATPQSPGRRPLAGQPTSLSGDLARPPRDGSPCGLKGSWKERLQNAHERGAVSPTSKSGLANTQVSPGRRGVPGQPRSLYGASARPLQANSPHINKLESGKQRLLQFWKQVLDKPDEAVPLSPKQQHPQATDKRANKKIGKCVPLVKGHAVPPAAGQCRQPFTVIQPREINSLPVSQLPRCTKPALQMASSKDSELVQARPFFPDLVLPSRPVVPLSDHGGQWPADVQAEGLSSCQGSQLPQHIKPCVPLAEPKDSGLTRAPPLPAGALPLAGDAVIKPESEHSQEQFGVLAPADFSSPSSRIPRCSRFCSAARAKQQVDHCSAMQLCSPSVSSALASDRLGDRICEPQEAAMDGTQTNMCTPPSSKDSMPAADRKGSDTSLSSGSSYSPLPSVDLHFKSPDFERFRSPFRDCMMGTTCRQSSDLHYCDSTPEVSPTPMTTSAQKIVAVPIPDSPAHYTDMPEASCSTENFALSMNVTLRRRRQRAPRTMSPLALQEPAPKLLTRPVEATSEDDEDKSEESDCYESVDSARYSGTHAQTVPSFMSPDIESYGRCIKEDIAKCYGAHLASPALSADSPASPASVVSTGSNIASSPPADVPPASSPSTLATAFGGLFARPRPSPISKPNPRGMHRLSTVMECSETSVKGNTRTSIWPPLEESLLVDVRQPTLLDGNFSGASPSMAFCRDDTEQESSQQQLSDSLISFMKHEQSIMEAANDAGTHTPKSTS